MITVVNKYTYSGPADDVMRGTVLGNPFLIGRDGTRGEVVVKHDDWLWDVVQRDCSVTRAIHDLAIRHKAGENIFLKCCCKPLLCHGDNIKRAVEWYAKYKLP